jgi:hypothetical protein
MLQIFSPHSMTTQSSSPESFQCASDRRVVPSAVVDTRKVAAECSALLSGGSKDPSSPRYPFPYGKDHDPEWGETD